MTERPGGAITFLFTDVEGSTRHWEADPEAMRQALARHDTLLREVLERSGGRVFQTTGDGFCAAFLAAVTAAQAALAAQGALVRQADAHSRPALRVRIALHSGPAELRDGDYFAEPRGMASKPMPPPWLRLPVTATSTHATIKW